MLVYLSESDVAQALAAIDPVAAVAAALAAHTRGETVLPVEAYLRWGEARSLSMPGVVGGRPGVKLINANPPNPARGLPRASGLTVLFDPDTARPVCVLEAARISCVRTAAVTALAVDLLAAAPIERMAIIGAGALARCHIELLRTRVPQLREIRIHDQDPARARKGPGRFLALVACATAEEAIRGAQLVVPVTTTTRGYIRHEWLAPGALLVNVSLDDALPEVLLRADRLFVDDLGLIVADEHRLLGRMLRGGELGGVDGSLGELLTGACEGRRGAEEIVVVNPFGLAIEDIAVADAVYRRAREVGLGTPLRR